MALIEDGQRELRDAAVLSLCQEGTLGVGTFGFFRVPLSGVVWFGFFPLERGQTFFFDFFGKM